jgi:hypothetical protein
MVQVAASYEWLEYLALEGSVDEPGRVEFVAVSAKTLIQRARPRTARAIGAASRLLRVRAHGRGAPIAMMQ